MLRTLTALGAAAVVSLGFAASASAQNDDLRVFVSNCEKQVYKPKTITVFCADAGVVIKKIKYSSYGAKTAAGSGTATTNVCEPNCAAGKTVKNSVTFQLSNVKQCGDSYQFRKLKVTYKGTVPEGQKRTITQTFQCADAPTR